MLAGEGEGEDVEDKGVERAFGELEDDTNMLFDLLARAWRIFSVSGTEIRPPFDPVVSTCIFMVPAARHSASIHALQSAALAHTKV